MSGDVGNMAREATRSAAELAKRIYIPLSPTSPPGLVQASVVDPWSQSGKYGLAWTYFALGMMGIVIVMRFWHFWQDKIRQAIYKQEVEEHYQNLYSVESDYALQTTQSTGHFFPETHENAGEKGNFRPKAHFSSIGWINDILALFRWVFYRPLPDIVIRKHRVTFSSLAVLMSAFIALVFVVLVVFLQQPLYWQSIQFGSPPLAIRSGMLSVAMTPWIIATSMKANIMSWLIGIGPERLNVFHRWLGYMTLFLALCHMIPFYIQPVWEDGGMTVFGKLFPPGSGIIYGSGIACIVPLGWLCIGSLPWIRRVAYEFFVLLHVPVGAIYVAVLFWHTKNYLMSWSYLYASLAIWAICYCVRMFHLNWLKPWRSSFLVGDEAGVALMAENAIKITVPTQMRWKPGQYMYLRMPGISLFENHPFTITSLCSEDFPSEYGEQYRDCVMVFKPYGGFTRKVFDTAIEKGPFHSYRAFLDGPYGGMRRDLAAFDTCILIAGGSGVTALISQLLNLVKRMRDGKAITRKVIVVWAIKKLESLDWFKEELRICRESAPPESVTCKFFVTGAVRNRGMPSAGVFHNGTRALTHAFHDKLDGFVAGIASKRNSAFIHAEAQGDMEREEELRAEDEDRITALPQQQFLQSHQPPHYFNTPTPPHPPTSTTSAFSDMTDDSQRRLWSPPTEYPIDKKEPVEWPTDVKNPADFQSPVRENESNPYFDQALSPDTDPTYIGSPDDERPVRAPEFAHLRHAVGTINTNVPRVRPTSTMGPPMGFDFGFPETPTEFQKNLMRSAFPVPHQTDGGWTIEYGRPDLGYMLKEWATGGSDGRGVLGRRTAVFVCGPPAMRVGVANTVARLQAEIWGDDELEEIFLHTENYAL